MYRSETLLENLENVRNNPAEIQRHQLDALQAASEGTIELVDATNPVVYLMEMNAAMGAAELSRMEATIRKLYPTIATSPEDVYRHMSDVDYLNRFATPSTLGFKLGFKVDALKAAVVPVGTSGVKKITIPRNTKISVDGFDFGFQYPIEIRLMPHGGFQVVFVNDIESPLWKLTSNLVPWVTKYLDSDSGKKELWLILDVTLRQFTLTSKESTVTTTSMFSKKFTLNDQFWYCRVYGIAEDGVTWIEYKTTHSDQIYDPNTVTAKLMLDDTSLTVSIPQIYESKGMVGLKVRTDIFTTKGPLALDVSNYEPSEYRVEFIDLDNRGNTRYTSMLGNMDMLRYAVGISVGGTNAMSFAELREQVIMHNTVVNTPITPGQLEATVAREGFSLVKTREIPLYRQFAASRALPTPSVGRLVSGAGTAVGLLKVALTDIVDRTSIIDNGTSVTITPDTLFTLSSGVVTILSEFETARLKTLAANNGHDELLSTLNGNVTEYLYSPWHYVLDTADDTFNMRPYYLGSPDFDNRNFEMENPTTQLEIGTNGISIEKNDQGYIITVLTSSGSTYQNLRDDQVHLQLYYRPEGEDSNAYLTGQIIDVDTDGNRIWQFQLVTNHYLRADDQILFTNFSMFDGDPSRTYSPLTQKFYFIWGVSDYTDVNDIEKTDIDLLLYMDSLPADTIGISLESVEFTFGTALSFLWQNSRTVKDAITYERYTSDVYRYYEKDVYETDASGNNVLVLNPSTNKYELVLKHSAGDPVLDTDGNHVIAHYAGYPVILNGELVPLAPRKIVRHLDMCLVDAKFYFATDRDDIAYRAELASAVVGYLSQITNINEQMLDETEVYYVPLSTLGNISVIVDSGMEITIKNTLSFVIKVYLDGTNYQNQALKSEMQSTIQRVIHESLTQATFSVDGVSGDISATLGTDAMAVYVELVDQPSQLTVFTAVDAVSRCSVKRKLVVMPEDTMQIQDDIEVQFIKHQKTR